MNCPDFNKYLPKWSIIAKIQKQKVVKTVYIWLFILPVFAKALSKVEDIATVTIFQYSFQLEAGLPFSWKVFYCCALLFSVANILFLWQCYSLIKDYSSFAEFTEDGKGQKQLDDYANEASLDKIDWRVFENIPVAIRLDNRYFHKQFWEIYEQLDTTKKTSRLICSLLYFVGFFLFAIIFFQNLYAVVELSF